MKIYQTKILKRNVKATVKKSVEHSVELWTVFDFVDNFTFLDTFNQHTTKKEVVI